MSIKYNKKMKCAGVNEAGTYFFVVGNARSW